MHGGLGASLAIILAKFHNNGRSGTLRLTGSHVKARPFDGWHESGEFHFGPCLTFPNPDRSRS